MTALQHIVVCVDLLALAVIVDSMVFRRCRSRPVVIVDTQRVVGRGPNRRRL